MKLFKLIVMLLCTVILTSCSSAPKLKPGEKKTIIFFFENLKHLSNYGGFDPSEIKLLGKLSNSPGKTVENGVNEYKFWWCTQASKAKMLEYATKGSETHCRRLGGNFKDKWCRSKQGDKPIFYADYVGLEPFRDAQTKRLPFCTGGRTFGVLASTSEGSDQAAWYKRAKSVYGFKTEQQITTAKKAKQVRQLETKRRKDLDRSYQANLIRSNGVGSRVCKKKGGYVYMGVVKAIQGDRMEIFVQEKMLKSGWRVNGFRPDNVIDAIKLWYPCTLKSSQDIIGE